MVSWWLHNGKKAGKNHLSLVGGWTNPVEKYESKWESSPSRVEKKTKSLKPPPSQQLQATRFTPTNSQENAKKPNQPARCLLGSTRLGKAAPMEPSLLDDMPFRSGVLDDRREVELYFWDLYILYYWIIFIHMYISTVRPRNLAWMSKTIKF